MTSHTSARWRPCSQTVGPMWRRHTCHIVRPIHAFDDSRSTCMHSMMAEQCHTCVTFDMLRLNNTSVSGVVVAPNRIFLSANIPASGDVTSLWDQVWLRRIQYRVPNDKTCFSINVPVEPLPCIFCVHCLRSMTTRNW